VLCFKILNVSDQVKKYHKNFQNLVFCNAFILDNREKLWPTSILKFERKEHIWDTLILVCRLNVCLFRLKGFKITSCESWRYEKNSQKVGYS